MKDWIDCGYEEANTGTSPCFFEPEYIKALVLTDHTTQIPIATFEEEFEKLIHADRPERIYPITGTAEYAPSGNEGQTNAVGYGPSQFSGYSPLSETWSLERRDEMLDINLKKFQNSRLRVMYIDEKSRLYAIKGDEGNIMGYEISSIFPQGQRFKSSGSNTTLDVIINLRDYARESEKSLVLQSSQDLVHMAQGLVWVELVKKDEGYKLRTKTYRIDVTERYGELLGKTDAWNNVTAASYDSATGFLTLTPTEGKNPTLKAPSQLYTLGIKYIEQWKGQ